MRTPPGFADHVIRTVTLFAAVAAVALSASALGGCNKRSVSNNAAAAAPAKTANAPTTVKASVPAVTQPVGTDDQEAPSPALPAPDASSLPVVPEPAQFELGYLTAGERKQISVNLRNTSQQPVTIARVQASCRCTAVGNYAGIVIPPGGTVPIIAQYDAPRETGPYHQRVWVYIEGFNDTYLTIPLEAEVVLAVRAVPGYLSSRETDAGYGPIKIEAVDGQPFRVLEVDGKEPVYLDDFKPGDQPRTSYLLQWDLRPYANPCNNMPWWLIIETDHPRTPLLDVRVRHTCTQVTRLLINNQPIFRLPQGQTWRLSEMRALAGVHKPGESFRMTLPVKDLDKQKIVAAVPMMSSIRDVKIIGNHWNVDHQEYIIEVTPAPDVRGLFKCVVDFTADDHSHCPICIYGVIRE